MGQISKTLSTFWFGWEYLSTLNHPLVQFSETAPCLAIANCVYYTVSKEKAIPLHGKMHFHRITPIHLTTNRWPLSDFPRSSLIGIHGQASKNWWCMSDFASPPPPSPTMNTVNGCWVSLSASLVWPWERKKWHFFLFPFHSLFLQYKCNKVIHRKKTNCPIFTSKSQISCVSYITLSRLLSPVLFSPQ